MDDVNDDHATAAVFRALSDPATLQLLVQCLEGQGGTAVETADASSMSRLASLAHAGLMTRVQERGMNGYRVTDPAAVQRLLDTVRALRPR